MPKTVEDLTKMFDDLTTKVSVMQKDFDLKLQSAEKDRNEYKSLAEKREEELRAFKADAEKKERDRVEAVRAAREAEIAQFVESQTKSGRIIPARKESVLAFMRSLASDTQVIEFSEKDGKKISHTPLSLFKEIFVSLKPVVPVGSEVSLTSPYSAELPSGEGGSSEPRTMSLLIGKEKRVLPVADYELDEKAKEYMASQKAAGISISYGDALIAVSPKRTAAEVN